MTEIDAFKAKVEGFISERGLTPSKFGKDFAGDPLFVFQLREGREPRSQTRNRIIDAMEAAQPEQAGAA